MKKKIAEVELEQFLKHGISTMTIKKRIEPMSISTTLSPKPFCIFPWSPFL